MLNVRSAAWSIVLPVKVQLSREASRELELRAIAGFSGGNPVDPADFTLQASATFGGEVKLYCTTLVQIAMKHRRLWLKAGATRRRSPGGLRWSDRKELITTFHCLSEVNLTSISSHPEPILYTFSCPHPGSQPGR